MLHTIHVCSSPQPAMQHFGTQDTTPQPCYLCSVSEVTVVVQNATLEAHFYYSNLTLTISSAVSTLLYCDLWYSWNNHEVIPPAFWQIPLNQLELQKTKHCNTNLLCIVSRGCSNCIVRPLQAGLTGVRQAQVLPYRVTKCSISMTEEPEGGWRCTQQKVFRGCGCLCLAEGIHPGSDPRTSKRLRFESALEESWSNPLPKAELASWLGQLVQGLTQTSFEDLQEWR